MQKKLEELQSQTFAYFANNINAENGLIADRTEPGSPSSIAAVGLGLSAFQTPQTDNDGMFWPQVIRGAAIMLCLLPPTRLALGALNASQVPDASGLFNLMRNLGGAIGLACLLRKDLARSMQQARCC